MRVIILLLLLPTILFAQDRQINPSDVLSSITADWNEDGLKDRAVLVENREMGEADLYLYIGTQDGFDEPTYAPQFVWSGSMWGQQPSLELREDNNLSVKSTNHGMGRTRWFQILTISYQNEAFVMTGFMYNYYDSIEPDDVGVCNIDFLTGRGTSLQADELVNKFNLSAGGVPVGEWNVDTFPDGCF